jgi:hypothetical protein
LKLGRKAAGGLGLGGSTAAIYSHSQERRDLLVLDHAAVLGGPASRSIRSNGLVREQVSFRNYLRFFFLYKIRDLDSDHTPLPAAAVCRDCASSAATNYYPPQ